MLCQLELTSSARCDISAETVTPAVCVSCAVMQVDERSCQAG